jgi:hypothetical protein
MEVLGRATRTCRAIFPKHHDEGVIVEKVEIKDVIADIISNSVTVALEHGRSNRNLTRNHGIICKTEYADLRNESMYSAHYSLKSPKSDAYDQRPHQPRIRTQPSTAPWDCALYASLNVVISSLMFETCLPDCVPHSTHESCAKRVPRCHKD